MKTKKSSKVPFIKTKKVFNIHDLDVNKILVSKKESHGARSSLKYLFGYNDDIIRPLRIKLPLMIGYVKNIDDNKTMSFKVDDNKLFKSAKKYGKKLAI